MRIGLLGAGTVGSALLDLLASRAGDLEARLGEPIEVAAVVVRNADRRRRLALPAGVEPTTDAANVVDNQAIEIVVEAMGGVEPAFGYVCRALRRGATVVTANKALLASRGPELFALARDHGADVLFEAAVGGAVPVVGAMAQALSGVQIDGIAGVLNGSTNFLLAMLAAGEPFDRAVARARDLGFLEADPADDVDGHDAARKVAILASMAGGRHVAPESVATRGLGGLEPEDMAMAAGLDAEVKLLAVAERAGEGYRAWVAPALVPAGHPLAAVRGAANAVVIETATGGETLLAGQGAGGGPTAMVVAGDVVAAASRRRAGSRGPTVSWRPAERDPKAAMPPMPHVVRIRPSSSLAALEVAVRAEANVRSVVRGGGEWVAVVTAPLAWPEVEGLRKRLGRLPQAAAVGCALVEWAPFGRAVDPWWRAPLSEPLVAAAREGMR